MNSEIRSLTALRGIAALGVVAFHAGVPFPGYLFVDLFFMLSGFVLMHAYGERFSTAVTRSDYKIFIVARLARIYPVHLLTILLLLPLFGTGPDFSLRALLQNLLLTQGPWYHTASWNYGAWSISAEWHAYLIFPVLVATIAARTRQAVLAIGLFCLLLVSGAMLINGSSDVAYTPAVLLRCLPEFVLGMVLYRFYREKVLARLGTDWACFAIVAAIVGFVFLPAKASDEAIRWTLPFLLLACAVNHARVASLLNGRILQYLGAISYPIYMVQMVSQFAVLEFLPDLGPVAHGLVFVAVTVALAIPISHYVEYPARDWLRGIRKGGPEEKGKLGWSRVGRRHSITLAARFRRWEPYTGTTAPTETAP